MSSDFPRRALLAGVLAVASCGDDSSAPSSADASSGSMSPTSSSGSASTSSSTTSPATTTPTSTTGTTSTSESSNETSAETTSGAPMWREVEEIDGKLGAFYSVWGAALDDLYIVGGRDEADQPSVGVLLHYDGIEWTDVAPPGAPTLHWVSPAGADVWVVGQAGTALRLEDGTWVEHETGTTERLWGVWGSAPDDVWAVGGELSTPEPLLIHYDGAIWSAPVAVPVPAMEARVAFKVWGTARDSVWVVGADGLAMHFDGSEWSVIPNESISDLISVYGNDDQVVAVGGRANARIARLTPASMEATTLDIPGASGVWMDDAGIATVVGDMGLAATLPATGLEPVVDAVGTPLLLHAVYGVGGELWAVGGDHFDATPSIGTVYRFGS